MSLPRLFRPFTTALAGPSTLRFRPLHTSPNSLVEFRELLKGTGALLETPAQPPTPTPTPTSSSSLPPADEGESPSSPSNTLELNLITDVFQHLTEQQGRVPPPAPSAHHAPLYPSTARLPPSTPFSGRSIPVRGGDLAGAYRRLQGVLKRNDVKLELRLGQYHEKKGEMRRRLARERHRRRFQELVRKKVQLVQMIRNRN